MADELKRHPVAKKRKIWQKSIPSAKASGKLGLTLLLILVLLAGCVAADNSSDAPDLSEYPWVYLRDGLPMEQPGDSGKVILVGDVMLGRGLAEENAPLEKAAAWLRTADLTLGNLECAIAPENLALANAPDFASAQQPFFLVAPASAAGELELAGFDLLGMANNHALDRGLEGLADTASALESAGMLAIGAAETPEAAYQAQIRPVGNAQVAFLAFNAIPSPRGPEWSGEVRQTQAESTWTLAGWDRDKALAAVRAANQQADAVVVFVHWGYEYDTRVDPAQREMATALVTAGADLIVGHHPHVIQAMEMLPKPGGGQALVAFSLGNFVFDQSFEQTDQSLALRAFFDREGLRAVQALPVHAGLQPTLFSPQEARQFTSRNPSRWSTPAIESLAYRCDSQACAQVGVAGITPELPEEQKISSAEIDLDGDGRPERVSLRAAGVQISGGSLPAWQSPADWQVIDLALGDPNLDGRQELLMAVRKPDRSGVVLSHPFVFGYRQGEYRLLWGGSAVSDPILEVELGDTNGDGQQELIVLEELHGDQGRAVSVWRWHGWGFSQVWRSPPGNYEHLRLGVDPQDGRRLIFIDHLPSAVDPRS
jgi:poly-gamma-glutamate capsule biosynthesis protein CapA/YwtB (metallophosphatase superfamily)